MALRRVFGVMFSVAVSVAAPSTVQAQTGAETFTGTATIKRAGGATASAPLTVIVERKMSQTEADGLTTAFKSGGLEALRKALQGVPPTGSVRLGNGSPTPTRIVLERPTDKGRLLTLVADQPIAFLGAGEPGAKSTEGYTFTVLDIELDAADNGSGTLSSAAKVSVNQGVFVVDDYAAEIVRVTDVKKVN